LLGEANIGAPDVGKGWVDGESEEIDVFDFGPDRFAWNERLVVEEAPLFLFFVPTGPGTFAFTGLPTIGGTGPLFSGRAPAGPATHPAFGSLWRLHTIELPVGAGVVISSAATLAQKDALTNLGLLVKAVDPADPEDSKALFKVTLKPADCFTTGAPASDCEYLDSQRKVEAALPTKIRPTRVLVTCPFVSYAGQSVVANPPPPVMP
jgi:hypothetical protein